MHADILAALACPDCRGRLLGDESGLACTRCGRRFEVERDVPRLLPSAGLDAEWEAKQELGQGEYNEAPATAVARRFGRFVDVNGIVLDVGSGVEPRPAYLEPVEGRTYVGLDPLVGTARRDFDSVQGVAERLPFGDETVDGAISATMLDHVPDPARVLDEIRRVLRPEGCLAVWIGVVDERDLRANALGPLAMPGRRGLRQLVRRHGLAGLASQAFRHLVWNRARAAATTLRLRFARRGLVAKVYADRARYHFSFFEAEDVLELLRQTGFRVLATERIETPGEGTSLFVLAKPEAKR
jgi:ubiquinone/menaquinone biosynthesis C-methylase UbiE/uncharacterized protein YbaR (Trm112 family)